MEENFKNKENMVDGEMIIGADSQKEVGNQIDNIEKAER